MTKQKIWQVYAALLGALIFPIVTLWMADAFSPNVVNGLTMILILAIIVGLFSAKYTISWLIIILITVASGFLLLGYVVMPGFEKMLLIVSFPIEASLMTVIRQRILHTQFIADRNIDVQKHIAHYDLNVKLQTYYNANKFYQRELNQIKHYTELDLWTNVEMFRWDRHQQIEEYHPTEHAQILRRIATALKRTRLKNEFIYYLGDGTFMVISPQIPEEIVKKINDKTDSALGKMPIDIPINLKQAVQKVDRTNCEQFPDIEKVARHLYRGLETDIIVEYLKDDQHD